MKNSEELKKAGEELAKTVRDAAGSKYKDGENQVKLLLKEMQVTHLTTETINAVITGISIATQHHKEPLVGIIVGTLLNIRGELEDKKKALKL